MHEVEPRRLLVGIRNGEQLRFFEQSTEKSQGHGSTVRPESIGENYGGVSRKIRRNEL